MFLSEKGMDLFAWCKIMYTFVCEIEKNGMNQNFTYILLCGIIILLTMFSGSGYCA